METSIRVRGHGVAAWCCVHLLAKAGFQPALEGTTRPRLPAIMLSEAALALIRDVFDRPDLFATAPRITRRVVSMGQGMPTRWHLITPPWSFQNANS